MPRLNRRGRRRAEEAARRVRDGYDSALSEGGIVLFQQLAPGVDGHFVSSSMTEALGWAAGAFRVPGTLRRLVHADDLAAFREIVPTGPILPPEPPLFTVPPVGPTAGAATPSPIPDPPSQPDPTAPAGPAPIPEPMIDLTDRNNAVSVQPPAGPAPAGTGPAAGAMSFDRPPNDLPLAVNGSAPVATAPDPIAPDPIAPVATAPEPISPGPTAPPASGTDPFAPGPGGDPLSVTAMSAAFTAIPATTQARVAKEPVIRFLSASGSYRAMLVRLAPIGPDEPVRGALVDVSVSEQQRTVQRRFAEIVDRAAHGHLVLEFLDQGDPASLVVRAANRAARRMFNLEQAPVDGTPLDAVFGESSAQLFRSALFDVAHTGESLTAERLTFVEVPGTYVDLRVDRLADGTLGVSIEDVTRTVAVEERLRHQASHDHLTGLPNRAMLEERLGVVTSSLPVGQYVALMLIDIEGLRDINRRYGHHVGDQLLVELGRRLVREIPGCEMVARIGGDEFAVLSLPHAVPEEALGRARAVQEALDRPLDLQGNAQSLRATIGAALAPLHGDDPRTLMRCADGALQQARADADPLAVYDPVEERTSIRRLGLLTQLRQGLANQELELRYQPMVELRTGRVTKVEALLRWQREDGGAHMPVEFLELAEQSGLIQPLTRWVLGEAARTAGRLGRDGERTVVSANLSLRNLYDAELLAFLDLLAASGELPADLVEIEISETELMDDPGRAQDVIAHLAGLGLRVVVDDFGTGYTSLSTMSSLAVTGLKIDRGFITTLSSVPSDAAVVRSTIELAHELGLAVTAEGVADADTLAMLTEMGCDFAQGFHLSEPVSLETLPRRVAELESAMSGWVGSSPVAVD
jgi:diguanylate cyclase (GGDEF)-like protein